MDNATRHKQKMERDQKIVDLYQSGMEKGEIMEVMDISLETVSSALRHGIGGGHREKDRMHAEKVKRDQHIIELYQGGMEKKEICKVVGLSVTTVSQILYDYEPHKLTGDTEYLSNASRNYGAWVAGWAEDWDVTCKKFKREVKA